MPILNDFRTIPEMYTYLTEAYGEGNNKYIMMRKVNDRYEGITYSDLKKETDEFAFGLAALGFKRDEKIAIISENRPEWIYSDLAALMLGGIDVPIYPSLTSDSIEFILNNSESKGVIVSTKLQLNKILRVQQQLKHLRFIIILNEKDAEENIPSLYTFRDVQEMGRIFRGNHPGHLKENLKHIKEDDLCTIIYTSGTTGEPKGVMLTHKNILSNVKDALLSFPIGENDLFLSFLPLCHIFERMAGYYTCFSAGSTMAIAESIETVAQNLVEVRPTIMMAVPRLFERIYSKIMKNVESQSKIKQKIFYWAVNNGDRFARNRNNGNTPAVLSAKYKIADQLVFRKLREKTGGRLRFLISGGAALPKELADFFEAVGIPVREGYGLTETSPVIAVNRVDDFKSGTVGKPLPNVEVKIAHDGEILVKSPGVMQGYYKNKKETEAVLKDGWLHTGDIGEFDSDGFLKITDRKKHLFKTSAGKYIAPTPIENLFTSSRYIDQFVLIGDRRMFLTALIVPDFDALKEYADTHKIFYGSTDDLLRKQEISSLFEKELGHFQRKLANYEKIRKFTLLEKPFSLETGEITPSLKVKRKIVEEKYAPLIEEMYRGLEKNLNN